MMYVIECSVMFPSKSLVVSGFTFKTLIYFELIFCTVLGSVLISFIFM